MTLAGTSVFIVSFNINGREFTEDTAHKVFRANPDADLVIVGLQEAKYRPEEFPLPSQSPRNSPTERKFVVPNQDAEQGKDKEDPMRAMSLESFFVRKAGGVGSKHKCHSFYPVQIDSQEYVRGHVEDNSRNEIIILDNAIGCSYKCVADIAMGEPAGKLKDGDKNVEWYGFIRMRLYAKRKLNCGDVTTFIAPFGTKSTSIQDRDNPYAKYKCPDKGAVGIFLEHQQLLIVNCHLPASNRYETQESKFDEERWRCISDLIDAIPMINDTCPVILLGDLNFRVEWTMDVTHKTRGGHEFQESCSMIYNGKLREYFESDRLMKSIRGDFAEENSLSLLLCGFEDCLTRQVRAGGEVHWPTFSFRECVEDNAPIDRTFWDKRTPAWTDRVLLRGLNVRDIRIWTDRSVVQSDHEPVMCQFIIESEFEPTIIDHGVKDSDHSDVEEYGTSGVFSNDELDSGSFTIPPEATPTLSCPPFNRYHCRTASPELGDE